jgi:2-methylcitrate dehydratase PrpD
LGYTFRYGQGPRRITSESLKDPFLHELFRRIEVYVDEEMESRRPKYLGSTVSVETRWKHPYRKVFEPKGDPDNPFGDEI